MCVIEAGGDIPCRPNPASTLLVIQILCQPKDRVLCITFYLSYIAEVCLTYDKTVSCFMLICMYILLHFRYIFA